MTKIYVQFADPTEQIVIGVFGCPQDETVYPNQGEIDSADSRYQEFLSPASTLTGAQQSQIAALSALCEASIVGGFTSSALGAPYTYPSTLTDQQNLTASVLNSMYPDLPATWVTPFWCENGSGKWAWVNHTVEQIQQVGSDAKASILAYMEKNAALADKVLAATTIAQVQEIVWA